MRKRLKPLRLSLFGYPQLSAEEYQWWMSAWQIQQDGASLFRRLDLDRNGYLRYSTIVTYLRQFHFSNDPELPGNYFYGHIS